MALSKKPDNRRRPAVSKQVANRKRRASGGAATNSREVKDEIHRLECYLVEAPRLFREKRLRERNRVDAPVERKDQIRAKRAGAPMTRVRAQANRRERVKHLFGFLTLLVVLYFLVAWVFYYSKGGL